MMRTVLVIALSIALSGCYSVRHRNDAESVDVASAAPAKASKKPAKQARETLPAGLGGDKANHAYTGDVPH